MNFYYWLGYHSSRLAGRLFFHFRVVHRERMIQSGSAILAMNHQTIQMRPSTFSVAIEDESYRLTPRVALLLQRLRALAIPPTTLVPFSTELLREVALRPAGKGDLTAIAFAVIEAVATGRDPKVVLGLFQRVVPLRFSVLPLEQDAVLDALRRFVRFKILGEKALV